MEETEGIKKEQDITIPLSEEHLEMLKEIEERWGISPTTVIRFGILLARRFYINTTNSRKE